MFETGVIGETPFSARQGEAALVIGNGPSLKDFDFEAAKRFTTFGMNSAYRFWHRIKWYPDYYCCLDEVVGESHKSEIAQLIMSSAKIGIKGFFLTRNVAEAIGNIPGIERVFILEEMLEAYSIFRTTTVTTGSHAALFAAFLGFKKIFLVGVDCNYVERVAGSEATSGIELKITKQEANPNYFFDDYQKVGDRYNLPNPSRNIHLATWREAATILASQGVDVISANLLSKVDCFDFCKFESIDSEFNADRIPPAEVLGASSDAPNPKRKRTRSAFDWTQRRDDTAGARATDLDQTISIQLKRPTFRHAAPVTDAPDATDRHPLQPVLRPKEYGSRWQRLQDIVKQVLPNTWRRAALLVGGLSALTAALLWYDTLTSLPYAGQIGFMAIAAALVLFPYALFKVRRNMNNMLVQLVEVETRTLRHLSRTSETHIELQAMCQRLNDACLHLQEEMIRIVGDLNSNDAELERVLMKDVSAKLHALDLATKQIERAMRDAELAFDAMGADVSELQTLGSSLKDQVAEMGSAVSEDQLKIARLRRSTARIKAALLQGRNAERQLTEMIGQLERDTARVNEVTREALGSTQRQLEEIRDVGQQTASRLEAHMAESVTLAEFKQASEASVQTLQSELGKLNGQLTEASKNSVRLPVFEEFQREVRSATKELALSANEATRELRALRSQAEVEFPKLQQADDEARLRVSRLPDMNILKYQTFTRALSDTSVKKIINFAEQMGVSVSERHLYYTAAQFGNLELSCRGRLATNVEDIILRSIVCASVRGNACNILEIGSLFGIGLGLVYNYCCDRFDDLSLTAIDPLDGYYGQGVRDVITDIPINVSTFSENIRRLGIPTDRFELVQRFSFDEDVYGSFDDELFDVVIIDGDHTYDGVKKDFDLYISKVKKSGFVIFDDYGSADWPDVQAYVDKEVAGHPSYKFVAYESRTCVYQRLA